LENGGPVRARNPEPSAEGAIAVAESGAPPPENFEKLYAISCNLAYIFGIRMASDIIQNWTFAEQKTAAATISIHTHTRIHTPHFQKLLGFRPLQNPNSISKIVIFRHCIQCKKIKLTLPKIGGRPMDTPLMQITLVTTM